VSKKTPLEIFVCQHCDAQSSKWAGRCLECGQWGTLEKQTPTLTPLNRSTNNTYQPTAITRLTEVDTHSAARLPLTLNELNRVLGGGLVKGSLTLLGGEPGIGKSTISLQIAALISPTLYFSGEESAGQIKMRADRLGIKAPGLSLANDTNVETVCATIKQHRPPLAIVDSIQTIFSAEANGEPGNINQIKASTIKLLETAKQTNTAIIIIGHVTKDGVVAGPRTLEHLVDTVLYLEGDRYHSYRILRTVKNRFGSTDEVGIFTMEETGLKDVSNPSACLLAERGDNQPGSVVTCLLEGTRPILVEVQALVNKTVFGYPVRKASGFDLNRLHVLSAVLQKRAGLNLSQSDIHLNVVGGIRADEPAADLAVCLAIASAYKDKALGKDLVVFGEVGLGGEVRTVTQTEKRIKECATLGMKRLILGQNRTEPNKKQEITLLPIKNIQELIRHT